MRSRGLRGASFVRSFEVLMMKNTSVFGICEKSLSLGQKDASRESRGTALRAVLLSVTS
jgi:hypothetical protein